MNPEFDGSVLIVGAGPTGLALAYVLRRQGVRARIVDAGSGPSAESRALAVQPRTLEVLGEEIAAELLARGRRIEGMQLYEDATLLVEVELSGTPTPYPFILGLSQSETERVLIAALADRGVEVEWETRATGVTDHGDEVEVTFEHADPARFAWVIGCDGVNSEVRESVGLPLDESPVRATWWTLADVRLSGEGVPPAHCGRAFLGRKGPLAFLPLETEGWWRVIAVAQASDERPEVTAESVAKVFAQRCPFPLKLEETGWTSAFRIREHVAKGYRKGRVLLAGDAAHAHSPVGGQGMNTGIQDACNLGWKLALVLRGAHDALLESYDAERRPIAEALVSATGRGTRVMTVSARWLVWLRNRVLASVAGFDAVQSRIRTNLEMLTVAYPDSPIVGSTLGPGDAREAPDDDDKKHIARAAGPGERAALECGPVRALVDHPAHTVFLFDGREASDEGDERLRAAADLCERSSLLRAVVVFPVARTAPIPGDLPGVVLRDQDGQVHEAFGASSESMVVVRPDGHIGWRGSPIDLGAFERWWSDATGLALRPGADA